MQRKFRMDTSFRRSRTLKLRSRRILSKKDLISELRDDILIYVLSFLPLKEAGRTSLLSKRWRHVWAYVPLLIFDDSSMFGRVPVDVRKNKYLRWVDQVVSSHKALTVDEIRIQFPLGEDSRDNIDNWVRFAMAKRVKRFELDVNGGLYRYPLPDISFCDSLTSLTLYFVDVTGDFLERLIYDCKALEFLSVRASRVLAALKVFSPSLKSFRLMDCTKLANLEISAPNLLCMHYLAASIVISFKNTPKLTELYTCGVDNPDLLMSDIAHQIEVFRIETCDSKFVSKVFPNCKRLKTLDYYYAPECDKDLFRVSSVIKACPMLHKLVLQVDSIEFEKDGKKWDMNKEKPWFHDNLKIVEIVGFAGYVLGFTRYLIKKFVSLEKLVIDPRQPQTTPRTRADYKKINKDRKHAEKLRAILEPEIKLEIL